MFEGRGKKTESVVVLQCSIRSGQKRPFKEMRVRPAVVPFCNGHRFADNPRERNVAETGGVSADRGTRSVERRRGVCSGKADWMAEVKVRIDIIIYVSRIQCSLSKILIRKQDLYAESVQFSFDFMEKLFSCIGKKSCMNVSAVLIGNGDFPFCRILLKGFVYEFADSFPGARQECWQSSLVDQIQGNDRRFVLPRGTGIGIDMEEEFFCESEQSGSRLFVKVAEDLVIGHRRIPEFLHDIIMAECE